MTPTCGSLREKWRHLHPEAGTPPTTKFLTPEHLSINEFLEEHSRQQGSCTLCTEHSAWHKFRRFITALQSILKADSHIAFRSPAMPFVNSHMPCRAPALLRPCRVLRESPHGSRKYPNCQSRSLTGRLFCSVLLPLFSLPMTNVIWFHTGHLHLRLVCYW
jgi:hypothetical protein